MCKHSWHENLDLTELSNDRHDIETLLNLALTQIKDVKIGPFFKYFMFFLLFLLITYRNDILSENVWQKVFKVICIAVLEFFVLLCLLNNVLNVDICKSSSIIHALIKSFAVFFFVFLLLLLHSIFQ